MAYGTNVDTSESLEDWAVAEAVGETDAAEAEAMKVSIIGGAPEEGAGVRVLHHHHLL